MPCFKLSLQHGLLPVVSMVFEAPATRLAAALSASLFPGISAALAKSTLAHVDHGFAQLFQREDTFQK